MAPRKHLSYGLTMKLRVYPSIRYLILRVVALILAIATFPCLNASAEPSLAATPEGPTLAPGREDRIIVTLRGVKGAADLRADPPAGVVATIKAITATGAPTRTWLVSLRASPSFDTDGTIILTAKAGHRLITSAVPVKARQAPSAASQLQAEVSFEGETLLDGLSRPLLVRISNLADETTRAMVEARLPAFLSADAGVWKKPFDLPARSTTVISIPVRTAGTSKNPLLSGKHEVAVVINVTRRPPASWSGQVVAVTTLNVGVPGMSEVQGLLQVPSFLLFPGFLLVTAFMLVLNAAGARAAPGAEPKDRLSVPWSSGLWLFAITLSMVSIPLYPYVSRLLGAGPRNILYGFDLGDVLRVWFVWIVLGVIAGLIVLTWRGCRARRAALTTFSPDLSPLQLLRRLAQLGLSTDIACLTLAELGDPRIHHLGQILPNDQTWATSAIACTVVDGSHPGFDQRLIGEAIRDADPAIVADRLEKAEQIGAIEVRWQQAGGLKGVRKVDASLFSAPEPATSIVTLIRGGRVP